MQGDSPRVWRAKRFESIGADAKTGGPILRGALLLDNSTCPLTEPSQLQILTEVLMADR